MTMITDFNNFISENELFSPSDKILLAVSGGIDSMVMASLFNSQKYNIGIAHCNFSLRGEESDKDEELVRSYAAENEIPFHVIRFDTRLFANENGLSVQMAAREMRYKWFEEIRNEFGYDYISVAHNLNDNIETLLINLIRGTGLAGMAGMKPVINKIVRPLLFATRNDILAFRNEHKIMFREDQSNSDTKYIRNKIRHLIIPVLKEINPSIETTLNETAERFSGLNEAVTEYIDQLRRRISEEKEQFTIFRISELLQHSDNKAIVFELFKPFGITNSLLADMIKVINGKTGCLLITETHRIIKNRNEIIIADLKKGGDISYTIESAQDMIKFPGISSAKYVTITRNYEIPSDRRSALIDAGEISFPVLIRKWKPGDYFYPLGMNQRKKLSDYFIDNKYSVFAKENIYVIVSDEKIVWIIGDRIDDRFKITKNTKEGLLIKATRKEMIIRPIK